MKRNNIENILLTLFVIVIISGLLFAIFRTQDETKSLAIDKNLRARELNDAQRAENIKDSGNLMRSTGTTGSGDVAVDIKPKSFENGKFIFDISLNTHSVAMDNFDLTKMTLLKFNDKQISPISVPTLSGHHNNGELVFEVDSKPEIFSIEIEGIPAVEKRVFDWGK